MIDFQFYYHYFEVFPGSGENYERNENMQVFTLILNSRLIHTFEACIHFIYKKSQDAHMLKKFQHHNWKFLRLLSYVLGRLDIYSTEIDS